MVEVVIFPKDRSVILPNIKTKVVRIPIAGEVLFVDNPARHFWVKQVVLCAERETEWVAELYCYELGNLTNNDVWDMIKE